jgi:hypothetical protein
MTYYGSQYVVGDWVKLVNTASNEVVYAKVVEILPESFRGTIIEYMDQRYNMASEFLQKVSDEEMMLWKLENADDKEG